MRTNQTTPQNIDAYIAGFPDEVQEILQKIRVTIHRAAPGAEEKISYQMPTFTLKGDYLIYFAGYKKHVGLYPAPNRRGGIQRGAVGLCLRQRHGEIPARPADSSRFDKQSGEVSREEGFGENCVETEEKMTKKTPSTPKSVLAKTWTHILLPRRKSNARFSKICARPLKPPRRRPKR